MGKSLNRVKSAVSETGAQAEFRELETPATTAEMAAAALGCEADQIAKSIVFAGEDGETPLLFLTAGGNQVDIGKAAKAAGQALEKADAAFIRAKTGFAIGGVAPVGHVSPVKSFMDPRLLEFPIVWAAAGTPHHVFSISPRTLLEISSSTAADFTK